MNIVGEQMKLKKDGEMAVVRVSTEGIVEVEREGAVTAFRPKYTLETVVEEFQSRGWAVADEDTVSEEVQKAVDEYLELHEQQSELKKKMDKLKKEIRPTLEKTETKTIKGTNGKAVYLQEARASNSTSRYTDYELKDIQAILEGDLLRKVTEIRVNAEKLDGVIKLEKLPAGVVEKINNAKIVNPGTPRFSVKK